MNYNKWRALIGYLRKTFPLQDKVVVSRRRIKRNCGRLTFSGTKFHIYIDSKLDESGQKDSLLHEWAHAKAIEEAMDHIGRWATMHGEIYESWAKNFIWKKR